jgi:preprotein translocase subunit SecB
MSDAPTENTQPQNLPPIRILGQYIKDLSFEVPGAPQIFNILGQAQVGLNVGVNVQTNHVADSTYEVVLEFNVKADAADQTAFLVEIAYGCIVALDETVIPSEQIHPLLNIEVARLMFPFPRQIISDLCSQAGFPHLLLQIVDFGGLYAARYGVAGAPAQGGPADGDTGPERTLN